MRIPTAPLGGVLLLSALTGTIATAEAQDTSDWLDITQGMSMVLELPKNASAIAVTNDEVAHAVLLASANKIMVQGVAVGSTDLVVQLGPGTSPIIYEVTVHQDLSDLIRRVDAIVEGEPPRVYPLKDRIVVQGQVDDLETLEQVAQVVAIYDEEFVNLMTVRGDHQVQLEVVFAEVSRSGLRELGVNWWGGYGDYTGSIWGPNSVTSQVITDAATGDVLVAAPTSGAFNLIGSISQPFQLAMIMSILDQYALTKILAQPTLVALSGQQADFLSGGEIPIPSPGSSGTIKVEYHQYGVITTFVPTVLGGDVIDTRVSVEVSEPDFSTGTRITGIEVPGFTSRRAKTHVRIDSGMTFAIAGLLSERTSFSKAQIPLLGDIPIIGALFRFVRHTREETELIVFVTPRLVRPLGPGEVPAPPGTAEDNNPSDFELYFMGMDHRAGSRTAKPTGNVGLER